MNNNLDSELPEIDDEMLQKGKHIASIYDGLNAQEIESLVKKTAEKSGQKIDWHYMGGVACIRVLGDLTKARGYLSLELECCDSVRYRFTTDNDSVSPVPVREDKK